MKTWFKVNLGDAMFASDKLSQIEKMILAEHQKTNHAKEIATFIRHESEGCLHCQVMIYFSPKSSLVAKAFNATSCAKPSNIDLSLFVGCKKSWQILFPEYDH